MEVILIRHTSVAVEKGTCYGQTDVPVAATFESEARQVLERLQLYGSFDAVYCSPLTRARMLATYCGYDPPIIDERLKEINMGDWEMQKYDEIKDANLQRWYDDYMNVAPTNGESFPMLYQRMKGFLDELRTKGHRRVAIFAHGGILLCAGLYAGLFSWEESMKHLAGYGGIERIELP